jgi:hypothetical protein
MPIRRYVKNGVVFTPQALSSMSRALEATTETLAIGSDEAKRRTVARFIIRLAREDDSLDAAALHERAVAALGGNAYSAPCRNPSALESRVSNELAAKRWILHEGEVGVL